MSEPTLKSLILCNIAFRDEIGRWNLIGIHNRQIAPTIPRMVTPFCAYFRVVDSPPDGELSFLIENPQGTAIWVSERTPYKGAKGNFDGAQMIPSFVVGVHGVHRFALYLNNERLGDTDLRVIHPLEMEKEANS